MENYGGFTGLYPLQKTLKFELRPQGRTMEHLVSSNFFEEDRDRAEKYKIVKKVIDNYHKDFINECLSKRSFDWTPLMKTSEKYYASKEKNGKKKQDLDQKIIPTIENLSEKDRKELELEQKRMRKEIVSVFKEDKRFKYLFSEKLFSILLKDEDYSKEKLTEKEILALKSFNKFSGYFIGLHKNRANFYSEGDESTAIAYRIVNENFPKFLSNLKKYREVCEKYPEIIQDAEQSLAGLNIKMDDIFPMENFNKVMTQDGIDLYNLAIGGKAQALGEKQKGLNEFLNEVNQSYKKGNDRIRMTPLFKQILSERTSYSYILDAFDDNSQLITSINGFFTEVEKDKEGNTFDRAVGLIASYMKYDLSRVYIRKADLNKVSMEIFGSWERLGGLLRIFKSELYGDVNAEKTSKKVDKWLNSGEFSLSDVINAIAGSKSAETFDEYILKMRVARGEIDNALEKIKCINGNFSEDENSKMIIKAILDSVQRLFHLFSSFQVRADFSQDGDFYAEYNEIYEKLFAIVPLYNRVRNYLTKNNLSMKKIKLNFKNPALANGWDLNKEYDNTAVIFLREGKYYLGIMNPSKKKNIKFEEGSGTGPFYKKMAYKLLPDPNKMLPKVFFAKKNINYYNPSDEIVKGYKAGKYKKGENFDIDFCHKLIDFFKESIQKNEDWRAFNYLFSATESYKDISDFYSEVEDQGYRMYFLNVPVANIDEYVEKGDLFLFQIYNKDFASGAKGNKDMHTIYWNAAFSDENLRNVVVKLNGEAELFYRDKSIIEPICHKKGEMLVNRTCFDKTPVPDKIHKELFDYHNGRAKTLSIEAKGYLDRVGVFQASYEIIKDRRYSENKMYFHVPLKLNFKADGKKNLNKMVIEKFLSDKDVHIIGIDRGERNLLYYSVIDRRGNIIDQDSLNIIDGFDYQKKLGQREIERREARQSWNSIGKIKDLKEGYLSKAVHKVSKMVLEYNAIVVLEDLNFGFKRGRFKVEKQVYQKFEKMLIDKLNYLVFKEVLDSRDAGGVLNAYQLTTQLESFNKLGKQSGILFYVPAAYTSKIDPTTGFVSLFNTSRIESDSEKKDFLSGFDSIVYSAKDGGIFAFKFDYRNRNFQREKTDHKNIWTVYTNGDRIKYKGRMKGYEITSPTKRIKDVLSSSGIRYDDGQELRDSIIQSGNKVLINEVYNSFIDTLQMRNSDGEQDYIISPVKNRNGEFFRTDPDRRELPVDADANGAYHIALRGELLMQKIAEDFDPKSDKFTMPKMEHKDWFEFMQTRGD